MSDDLAERTAPPQALPEPEADASSAEAVVESPAERSETEAAADSAGHSEPSATVDVSELRALAEELEPRDTATAEVIRLLAAAVADDRLEQARAYANAIDTRAAAERLEKHASPIWGVLEVLRAALLFAPIALTWFGLATASEAYAKFVANPPSAVDATKPFLVLWQRGFEPLGGTMPFGTLALLDFAMICGLIALSLLLGARNEFRDPRVRARVANTEARLRRVLAQAVGTATRDEMSEGRAASLYADYISESREIYERALAADANLIEFGTMLSDMKAAARELGRFARSAQLFSDRSGDTQATLISKIDALSQLHARLALSIDALGRRLSDVSLGSGVLVQTAGATLAEAAEQQQRMLDAASEIIRAVEQVRGIEDAASAAAARAAATAVASGQRSDAVVAQHTAAAERVAASVSASANSLATASSGIERAARELSAARTVSLGGSRGATPWVVGLAALAVMLLLAIASVSVSDALEQRSYQAFLADMSATIEPLVAVHQLRAAVQNTPVDEDKIRLLTKSLAEGTASTSRWIDRQQIRAETRALLLRARQAADAAGPITAQLSAALDEQGVAALPQRLIDDVASLDTVVMELVDELSRSSRER